ncbi:MAG: extracellular solute-binding protein [Rhizobiales bacterium]|nr:extracellular solute-binding protein [Hyphomicrobiales bacterium]
MNSFAYFRLATSNLVTRHVLPIFTLFCFILIPISASTAQEVLRIGGTGSALAAMKSLVAEYAKSHPDINIVIVPSLGSGGGIKALIAGKIDISLSARALKDKEKAKGVAAAIYARAPMVFATHQSNVASDVPFSQLASAYSGQNLKWQDGLPLRPIMRPASESDIKIIRSLSVEIDAAVQVALNNTNLFVALNDQDNADALERVPGSLGFLSLGQVRAEQRKIKILSVNGVTGTLDGVVDGTYPHAKTHRIVLAKACKPVIQAFIEFLFSAEGKAILTSTGHATQSAPDDINQCLGAK